MTDYSQDEACWGLLGDEVRDECMSKCDEAREVDVNFLVKAFQFHRFGFGEVMVALQACIQEDAVQVWRRTHDPVRD